MASEHIAADLLHLLDVLGLDELQAIQDSLAGAAGVYASLGTLAGQPLTRPTPLPAICMLLQRDSRCQPDRACGFASSHWRKGLAEAGQVAFARCPYGDLQLAAVPLRVQGRLLAILTLGRVPSARATEAWLQEAARRLRLDEAELQAALLATPVVEEARFRSLVTAAETVLRTLGSLAEARLAADEATRTLETTNRRLGTLGAIAAAVIRSPTWQESLGQALQTILDVLRLDSGAVFLRGEGGGPMRLVAHRGVGPEFVALVDSEVSDGFQEALLFHESELAWVVPDVFSEPGLPTDLAQHLQIGAFVAVPLRAADDILGALTLHTAKPRAFQPNEVALMAAAGEQLGIGVQTLRLLAAEKRRAGELAILNEVAVAVGHSLDLQVIVDQALNTALQSFRAGAGLIYLQEEGSRGAPVLVAHRGLSPEAAARWSEQPPMGWDADHGLDQGPRWGANAREACSPPDLVLAEGLAGYVSAPLRGQQRSHGLLIAFSREPRAILGNEVELFQAIGHEIGLALENAELYRETRRRLADLEALQHFNERILHTMQESIFIVSARGRISYATPRLAELTGYGVDELIGGDWLMLAKPEDHGTLRQVLQAALAGRSTRSELSLVRKDGGSRHVSLGAVPLSDAGTVTGMLGVASDLTEEVQLRSRLRQAEKLSALGELVSGVAHELNNPLTVIRGYAQLLLGREDAVGASRELQAITEHAERAAHIVQELLTFARERPPARQPVDLNAVLQSVLDLREREMAAAGIRVVRRLAPGLPRLQGDPYQLQQVFLNILTNAEQALAETGHEGLIEVSTSLTDDGQVVATIRDNGPGIPAAVADRIFDPFFTTKADRQGTGLGLSICYGIVNAHGGRIWADSIEGQGAAFSVVLPVTTVEAPSHGEAPPPPEPAAPAGRHVLILEDEVEIARLMARYLERLGYRASVAHEARAALQMIAEESPDLVLTDLKMPGMSGREFYAELRKTCPELAERVIFVTGDTVSPDTQSFLKQIGRPHLAKPFSLEEVRAAVAAALG